MSKVLRLMIAKRYLQNTMSRRGYDGHGLCGKTGKIQNNDHYGTIACNRITTDRINIISIMIRKHKHMLNECGLRLLENAVRGLRRPRRESRGLQNKMFCQGLAAWLVFPAWPSIAYLLAGDALSIWSIPPSLTY